MFKERLLSILCHFPLQDIIIFESHPDFSDNSYYIFEYLVQKYNIQNKYKLVWYLSDYSKRKKELLGVPITCVDNGIGRKSILKRIRRVYYNYVSKVIVNSNVYIQKKNEAQIRIFLDHGMPLKEAVEYQQNVGKCDLLSVSGDFFKDIYDKYTDPESVKIYGLPRDEPLYDIMRKDRNEKFVLWMPTFRQHKDKNGEPENIFPFGIPVLKNYEQLENINRYLEKKNMKLLLRLHPAQDTRILEAFEMSNIIFANNEYLDEKNMLLEDLLAESDALITDYSSVYYDYLFTKNPIGLTFEDAKIYQETMKLVFEDIENTLPGKIINSIDDLIEFLDEVSNGRDEFLDARNEFMEKLGMKKIPSCKLITDFLMQKIKWQICKGEKC